METNTNDAADWDDFYATWLPTLQRAMCKHDFIEITTIGTAPGVHKMQCVVCGRTHMEFDGVAI